MNGKRGIVPRRRRRNIGRGGVRRGKPKRYAVAALGFFVCLSCFWSYGMVAKGAVPDKANRVRACPPEEADRIALSAFMAQIAECCRQGKIAAMEQAFEVCPLQQADADANNRPGPAKEFLAVLEPLVASLEWEHPEITAYDRVPTFFDVSVAAADKRRSVCFQFLKKRNGQFRLRGIVAE